MSFPALMVTRTTQVGPGIFTNGTNTTGKVWVSVYEPVRWTATHALILPFPRPHTISNGVASFLLPTSYQSGIVDAAGVSTSVTGFAYRMTFQVDGMGSNQPPDLIFYVPTGAGTFYINDLDAVASTAPPARIGEQPTTIIRVNGVDYTPAVGGLNDLGTIAGGGGGGGATNSTDLLDKGTVGVPVFQSDTQAEAKTALGIVDPSGFMATVLDDTTAGAALTTLGLSAFVKTLMDDADASAFLTTLGVSAFVQTLLNDPDISTFLSTLGVSTFVKTFLDDATGDLALGTLGATATGLSLIKAANAAAVRTAAGATSTGSSAITAADAAALAAAAGLGSVLTTLTTLQNQVDTSPVMVIESAGTYTVPAGTSSARTRIFKGVTDPTGLAIFRAGDVALLDAP